MSSKRYIQKKNAPARGFAREDATANPGINVLSSISMPNKSKSRPEPNTYLVSKPEISSQTATKKENNTSPEGVQKCACSYVED